MWLPGLFGAVASMLHPWQGELMILIIVGAELIRWRENLSLRRLRLPVLTLVLTGLPLIYYVVLGHVDISWGLAREASKHSFSFWSIAHRDCAAGPGRRARLSRAAARLPRADVAAVAVRRRRHLLHVGHGAQRHAAARI